MVKRITSLNLKNPIQHSKERKKFWNDFSKLREETKLSSNAWRFYPTIKDWKIVIEKRHCVILDVTSNCNSDCRVCYVKGIPPADEISLDDIKNILKRVGKKKRIGLFGGEPTVREDIFKIIDLIQNSKNIPELYTNGLKLSDLNYVKKLKESGLERIYFSFDGFNKEIYQKLRGDGNQLYLKLKALRNLEKVGIETFLSSTIAWGINEHQIPELLRLCSLSVNKNNFIRGIRFFDAVPFGKFEIEVEKFSGGFDIIKFLEECTDGKIRTDYFIEFRRFILNVSHLLEKIGIYFPIASFCSFGLFSIKNNEIEEFIPLKKLKKINDAFERRNILSLLSTLLKNRELRMLFCSYIKNFFSRKRLKYLYKHKILFLYSGVVSTPITHIQADIDSIEIAKRNDKIEFGTGNNQAME